MTDVLLDIAAIGRRGEGVARHDGAAVFVPLSLPGETVRAAVDGDRGLIQDIVKPSPDRIAAFCSHYGTCGGCQLQHWRAEPYSQWKAGLVEAALRSRGLSGTVRELIDAHGSGRRRVSIHARRKDGVVTAGFMASRSHNLLDLARCPILVPELDSAFDLARKIGVKLGDCDVSLTALQGGVDASVRAGRKIVAEEQRGLAAFAAKLGVARFSVNGEVILTPHTPFAAMGKALVPVPPGSFLQATAEGEEVLARLVCEAAGKSKHVADLFCGCGPFTFRLAERAKVQAFDSDRPAIAALNAAARVATGLKPIAATVRDLFREPLVAMELKDFDAVVFDPPRAGAEAQARQLAKSRVKTVVAVSCDAASFARDAEILINGGYAMTSLAAVDQFKWTSHVEIVAGFGKR